MITTELIQKINTRLSEGAAADIAKSLSAAAGAADINTPARVAMWLAQLAHESGGFRYIEELWGPTSAQQRYEGRRDLGNVHAGDGYRYRGRGWIQLTGRYNYRKYGGLLGIDLEARPELAATPEYAARIAAEYWKQRGLNGLADAGNFREITRRINGGYNGLADRERYHKLIQEELDVSKVFMVDKAGKNVEWDGKTTIYGGVKITRYPDGAIQLERVEKKG